MSGSTRSPLTKAQRLAYGLPALAMALPTLPIYVLLPVHYAAVTSLSLVEVGAWLLAARLVDVATDGMAALLCDRPLGRFGRKGWMGVGALLLAPGLLGLAMPPADAGGGWLFGFSVLLFVGWTLVQINYTAWLASLADSPGERLRLSSLREGIGLVGLLCSAAWPAIGGVLGWSDERVFQLLAWTTVLWGGASLAWMLWSLPQPASTLQCRDWKALFRLAPQRRLLLVWGLNGLANAVAAVLFPLIVTVWLLAPAGDRGIYMLLYFGAALAAMPIWRLAASAMPQDRLWCVAMILATVTFALMPLLSPTALGFGLVVVVTGATLGADLALPHSIQAAVVRWEETHWGRSQPALHFAGVSLVNKLALGIGVAAAPALLAMGGWQDGTAVQSEAVSVLLVVIYSWVPCVLKGMAITLMWGFQSRYLREDVILAKAAGGRLECG